MMETHVVTATVGDDAKHLLDSLAAKLDLQPMQINGVVLECCLQVAKRDGALGNMILNRLRWATPKLKPLEVLKRRA